MDTAATSHIPDRTSERSGAAHAGTGRLRITGIRLRNFKMFRKASVSSLPPVCYFVGANGTGKSTLFDVFAFLRDCTVQGVGIALDKRGGYREVLTREAQDGIGIELTFRMDLSGSRRLLTYSLEICADPAGAPYVERETLRCKTGANGVPRLLIDFSKGNGEAVSSEEEDLGARPVRETLGIGADVTALAALGNFPRHKEAFAIRSNMAKWHVSDFHLTAAELNGKTTYRAHLSADGENLGVFARQLQEDHSAVFEEIRKKMAFYVPGITSVDTEPMGDGSILLKFKEAAYRDPFVTRQMSDGTIQLFACLALLHDPRPHPLLCIEEPEEQLYPSLLKFADAEFHGYASRGEGQVLVSTHSPELLDSATIGQVCWLTKKSGATKIRKASRDVVVAEMAKLEPLGQIWVSNCFEGANPDE